MGLLNPIAKVPDNVFKNARNEVLNTINWNKLPFPDTRSQNLAFKTSIAAHLRVHKVEKDTLHTIEVLSQIVECVDTQARIKFPNINALVDWICKQVSAVSLGRIMVVKLLAGGIIPLHIDPGKYFEYYYRFHVPLVTDHNVIFTSDVYLSEHMPLGYLTQLKNRKLHGVQNNSSLDRIHLIVDIESKDSNLTY